jgi:hypothetical protein
MTDTKLHLVIVHNAAEGTYSLSKHNQASDEAKDFVENFNPHMKPGYTLITIEQRRAHKTEDAQQCRACRETVRLRSRLQPIPKFVRRKE